MNIFHRAAVAAAATFICLVAAGLAAEGQTGRQMLALCAADQTRSPCYLFLRDQLNALEAAAKDEPLVCAPQDLTPQLLIEAFVNWADDNPDELDQPAVELTRLALTDVFPCGE